LCHIFVEAKDIKHFLEVQFHKLT